MKILHLLTMATTNGQQLEVNNSFISFKNDTGAYHFECFEIYKIVLSYNQPSSDYLLIMAPKFQSKVAAFYGLHVT